VDPNKIKAMREWLIPKTLKKLWRNTIKSPLKGNTKVQVVEDHIGNQKEVLKLLKDNLVMAQNIMKKQTYQHRSEREFKVGD
jgi:hypothetical protein